MNFKDRIKLALLQVVRDYDKKYYVLILFILNLLCLTVLNFDTNINNLMSKLLNNNPYFRTITVTKNNNNIGLDDKEKTRNSIEEISKIENVIDVYPSEYGEAIVIESDFKNNNIDGAITLKRATDDTQPLIVAGKKINKNDKGVMICPQKFFPNSNSLQINKKYLIDGRNIINKEYNVYYYNYKLDDDKRPVENERLNYKFKIIGLYDNSTTIDGNDVCYISAQDLEEIVDNQQIQEEIDNETNIDIGITTSIEVVVNNIKNITNVSNELKNQGYKVYGTVSYFDTNTIKILHSIIIIILFICISASVFITILYIKKKIIKNQKYLATLKVFGYSKKEITLIHIYEFIVLNTINYIISGVIFYIIMKIFINTIPILIGINMMVGGIKITIISYILTYLILTILPAIIVGYKVSNKCEANIYSLIKGD